MANPLNVKPNDKILISIDSSVKTLIVQPDPLEPANPYFENGGTGSVLQLKDEKAEHLYALKIFATQFQEQRVLDYAENLSKLNLNEVPGLKVANRTVIDPKKHQRVIEIHNSLRYALVMPWISGHTWQEVLVGDKNGQPQQVSQSQSFMLAANLCSILKTLEDRHCSHCDICGNNIIVDLKTNSVELIDIEDMYGPGFIKNLSFVGGQKGYTHQRHKRLHQWDEASDRFGGAILIAEMMGWYSPQMRKESGEESYFPLNRDLHVESKRLDILLKTLEEQTSRKVVELFMLAWKSSDFSECPPFSDWYMAIEEVAKKRDIRIKGMNNSPTKQTNSSPITGRRQFLFDGVDTVDISPYTTSNDNVRSSNSVIAKRREFQSKDSSTDRADRVSQVPNPTYGDTASSPKSRNTIVTHPIPTTQRSKGSKSFWSTENIVGMVIFVLVMLFISGIVFPDLIPSVLRLANGR